MFVGQNKSINMVTVKQLIESLSQFPMDAPVQIALSQYNKANIVAYCDPVKGKYFPHEKNLGYANMYNGRTVRIECQLPDNAETFMIISTRKK